MRAKRTFAQTRRNEDCSRHTMTDSKRQMHLAVFVVGTGNHSAGWRHDGAFDSNCSWPVLESIAKTAERGKFDLFFVSDGLTSDADDQPSFATRFEPTTLLGAVSRVTKKVGLGATVSTNKVGVVPAVPALVAVSV